MINSFWHIRESTVGIRCWQLAEILSPGLLPFKYWWKQDKNASLWRSILRKSVYLSGTFLMERSNPFNKLSSGLFPRCALFKRGQKVCQDPSTLSNKFYVECRRRKHGHLQGFLNWGRWNSWLKWFCFSLCPDSPFTWQQSVSAELPRACTIFIRYCSFHHTRLRNEYYFGKHAHIRYFLECLVSLNYWDVNLGFRCSDLLQVYR